MKPIIWLVINAWLGNPPTEREYNAFSKNAERVLDTLQNLYQSTEPKQVISFRPSPYEDTKWRNIGTSADTNCEKSESSKDSDKETSQKD
jgi:hypothetical protein